MNKLVASVGLVALSASALQSASAQALGSPDSSKPWSVSASLRGFYDDNISTAPKDLNPTESTGFEITPSAAFNWALQQTTINLGFLYTFKYYDKVIPGTDSHHDNSFTFSGSIDHSFSERLKASVADSFVIGQEPDMLRAQESMATFQRISGDNIRNFGSIGLNWQLTPKLGLGAGYDNAYYDYSAAGAYFPAFGTVQPSPSGTLDRMEHRAHLEALWFLTPETKLIVGYQFTAYDYTGDEVIGGQDVTILGQTYVNNPVFSSDRNARQHTFYVGTEHAFSPTFNGSVRAGGSYSDYYNSPTGGNGWSPYLNGSLKYTYAPESYIEGGVSYDISATDVVGYNSADGSFTLNSQAAVVYASLYHRIIPQLYGSLIFQFQNSLYKGGLYDNESEQFYLLGLNLEWRFTRNFAASFGYNYDRLESKPVNLGGGPFDRSFDRNRVYIGLTASY
jgi:hypothetical protein